MEDDNYITIQGWMINRLGLSGNDLIVYAIIYGFSQDGENWYTGSQKYLADSTKTSVRTVIRVLNRLLDKGYIEKREVNKKGVTLVDYRTTTTMSYPMSKCHKGTDKMSHTLCQNVIEGTDKMSHHNTRNHIDRNINIEHKKEIYREIVDYLNQTCGTNYRWDSKQTQKLINARLNEGFTIQDFQTVILKKSQEWLEDTKMCKFLRPQTLFGTKFENYLNEPFRKKKDFKDILNEVEEDGIWP